MSNEVTIVVKAEDQTSGPMKSATRSTQVLGEKTDQAATKASTASGAFGALASGVDLLNLKSEQRKQALSVENGSVDQQIAKLQQQKDAISSNASTEDAATKAQISSINSREKAIRNSVDAGQKLTSAQKQHIVNLEREKQKLQENAGAQGTNSASTSKSTDAIDAQIEALTKKKAANDKESADLDKQEQKHAGLAANLMKGQLAFDALSGVTDIATLALNGHLLTTIKTTAATVASTVSTIASGIAQKAVAMATGIWTAAQWLLNAALDANPIGLVILGIAALIGIVILIATKTHWFQNIWKVLWGFLKTVGAWFAGPFAHFFVAAFNVIVGAVKWYFNIYKSVFTAIINFVRTVPGKIVGFFSSLGARFQSIGSNIIHGIINGITHGVGALKNAVSNAAKSALNAAKSFLGIHSPSTVFRDQVGKQMAAGQAQGYADNIGAVTGAVGAGSRSAAGAVGSGGGGGGMAVTFNGNTDTAFATAFMKMVNSGLITIKPQYVR